MKNGFQISILGCKEIVLTQLWRLVYFRDRRKFSFVFVLGRKSELCKNSARPKFHRDWFCSKNFNSFGNFQHYSLVWAASAQVVDTLYLLLWISLFIIYHDRLKKWVKIIKQAKTIWLNSKDAFHVLIRSCRLNSKNEKKVLSL